MDSTESEPVYTSRSTVRSLWQTYYIYADRLELDTHFGTLKVPFEHIERLDVQPSDVKRLVTRGDLQLKNFRPALKVDWANFVEHIVLDKSEGRVRRILFTPEDPAEFQREFDSAFARFKQKP